MRNMLSEINYIHTDRQNKIFNEYIHKVYVRILTLFLDANSLYPVVDGHLRLRDLWEQHTITHMPTVYQIIMITFSNWHNYNLINKYLAFAAVKQAPMCPVLSRWSPVRVRTGFSVQVQLQNLRGGWFSPQRRTPSQDGDLPDTGVLREWRRAVTSRARLKLKPSIIGRRNKTFCHWISDHASHWRGVWASRTLAATHKSFNDLVIINRNWY